jgi:hypothetical protein
MFCHLLFGDCTFVTCLWDGYVNFKNFILGMYSSVFTLFMFQVTLILILRFLLSLLSFKSYKDPLFGRSDGATPRNSMELCNGNRWCHKWQHYIEVF